MKRLLLLALVVSAGAQEPGLHVPKVVPVPTPKYEPAPAPKVFVEPQDPPPQNFVDSQLHLYFHLGPGWRLEKKDGEVSTFHLDARSAPPTARLRAVAMLAFNPYPVSTFSGAMFYYSVIPHSSAQSCEAQVRAKPEQRLASLPVAGVPFWRGLDEQVHVCTESRDVAYTAMYRGSCLRFDLTVNTFCGGDVSGALEMTDQQLARVFQRMEAILETVEFRNAARKSVAAAERTGAGPGSTIRGAIGSGR